MAARRAGDPEAVDDRSGSSTSSCTWRARRRGSPRARAGSSTRATSSTRHRRRLAGQLQVLLAAAVATPARPCPGPPTPSPEERRTVSPEWNATGTADCARDAPCLHRLVEAGRARTPDAVAVTCEGGEPDLRRAERAGQPAGPAAARPRRRPGDAGRALPAERSPELVVAILGDPQGRRRLRPARPRLPGGPAGLHGWRTPARRCWSPRRAGARPRPASGRRSWTPRAGDRRRTRSRPPPERRRRPDHSAYVIYTSGSTGRPKGVVRHRTATSPGCSRRPARGSASAPPTCGRCSTPTPSTSRSGRCGARCSTAAAWSSCPTR